MIKPVSIQVFLNIAGNVPLWIILFMLLTAAFPATDQLFSRTTQAVERQMAIRGQRQKIIHFSADSSGTHRGKKVLFAPGDAGMYGAAVDMARTIASIGYEVFGLDTKNYLEGFTRKAKLQETEVMTDFRQIAGWITGGAKERVILAGWSEGAGLCLLAAAAEENKAVFDGFLALGLPEKNVLGWRLLDDLTYITRKTPREPTFSSSAYLPRIAPLPLVLIQASHDDYVTVEAARSMFSLAGEPKKFILVETKSHRFDSNKEGFARSLRESLEWILDNSP